MSKKIKKGKLALLALAGSAFVASLLYDKNQKNKKDMENLELELQNIESEELKMKKTLVITSVFYFKLKNLLFLKLHQNL